MEGPEIRGAGRKGFKVSTQTIKSGDWIYFHRDNYRNPDLHCCYRTVRAVVPGGVKVYHLGLIIILPFDQINKVTKLIGHVRGITELSKAMYRKGITNEALSIKSGYSLGTVDRVRRDIRVKPRTLADIWDTVNGWDQQKGGKP